MTDSNSAPLPPENGHQWSQRTVYSMLTEDLRREMILSLARRGPQTASALAPGGTKRVDSALKHLAALRAAGFVVTKENPVDGRRFLYALSPAVVVRKTETGCVIDFGFCIVVL